MIDASPGVFESIRMCGGLGWLAILLGVLGAAIGIASIAVSLAGSNKRIGMILGGLAFGVGALSGACGAFGMVRGRAVTDEAVSWAVDSRVVDQGQRDRLRDEGYREAGMCLPIGGFSAAPAVLLGLAACAAAFVLGRGKNEGDARPGA